MKLSCLTPSLNWGVNPPCFSLGEKGLSSQVHKCACIQTSDANYLLVKTVESALLGAIQRLVSLPLQFMAAFYPNEISHSDYTQITEESINNNSVFSSPLPPQISCPKDRLRFVLNRVNYFAHKAQISEPIELYTQSTPCPTGCIGSRYSLSSPMLFLDVTIMNLPDDQLDFVLNHEIAGHIKNNDSIKNFLFSFSVALIDILFWIHFPIGIFATEGAAFLTNVAFSQCKETYADKQAITLLKTNRGATDFFQGDIQRNIKAKNLPSGHPFPGDPRKNSYASSVKSEITAEGNLRRDLHHPPLTTRLAYSKKLAGA